MMDDVNEYIGENFFGEEEEYSEEDLENDIENADKRFDNFDREETF